MSHRDAPSHQPESEASSTSIEADDGGIALQKWLQWHERGTRDDARAQIQAGHVRVNGTVVTRFAHPVEPEDRVEVEGRLVAEPAPRTLLLLHKPRRHLSALMSDDATPHLGAYVPEVPRVFCVGRLDVNTEGALLLTNDGRLARRVLDPDVGLPKLYRVKVRDHLDPADPGFDRIRDGLVAEDGERFRPAVAEIETYRTRATWVRLVLTEGRFREIRRMCARNRWQVVKLQRASIGPIALGSLRPRCVRPVTAEEEAALKSLLDCLPNPKVVERETARLLAEPAPSYAAG